MKKKFRMWRWASREQTVVVSLVRQTWPFKFTRLPRVNVQRADGDVFVTFHWFDCHLNVDVLP